MFSVISLQCLTAVLIFSQVMAYSPLTCNTGIYQYSKTIIKFNVIQDKCEDEADDNCFQQCSSFTDVVGQTKGVHHPGFINITWNFNGEATIYLMRYSIQPQNGIQDIYHTCLHFVGTKELPHQEWYKVTLQCDLSVYAIIQVTLNLPSGSFNSTSITSTSKTSQHMTTTMSTYSISALPIEETEKPGSKHGVRLVTWLTVTVVVILTLFITAAAVYIRRVIKKKANADLTGSFERTNRTNNCDTFISNNNIATSNTEPLFGMNLTGEQHYTKLDSDNLSNGNHSRHLNNNYVQSNSISNSKSLFEIINFSEEHNLQNGRTHLHDNMMRQSDDTPEHSDVDSNLYHHNCNAASEELTQTNLYHHNIHTAPVQLNQTEPHFLKDDTIRADTAPAISGVHTNRARYQQRTQDVPIPAHLQNQIMFLNLED